MMAPIYSLGMVHGRFQPLHKEHLEYIKTGLGLCENLVVGITNPEPSELIEEVASSHRHKDESNPFSYYQREMMIFQSLRIIGIDVSRVICVPFHIFDSSKWSSYLPAKDKFIHLIREFSEWESKKIKDFSEMGYKVAVLDKGATKGMTATEVRSLLRSGGSWQSLVPEGTRKIICEYGPENV
jgi:cytidyltransferase-like protein